ncbi:fibroblast growth factor receptor 1-like isoform X2 [Montipora foliosa]|uniref:fibroblast growth factor receptor 1-like isoform X2 n=1 Tax=Montipora foliosa TaxID=591990 RepID=UPI0035F1DC15
MVRSFGSMAGWILAVVLTLASIERSEAQFWTKTPGDPVIVVQGVNSTDVDLVWKYNVPETDIVAVAIRRKRQRASTDSTVIALGFGQGAKDPKALDVSDQNLRSEYRAFEDRSLGTYTLRLLNVNNDEEYVYSITVNYRSSGAKTADDSVFVDVKVKSEMVFTSSYNGKSIFGTVGSSVSFKWSFSGGVQSITWGLKNPKDPSVIVIKLVILDSTGSVSVQAPASYSQRVSGVFVGNASSGHAIFTISSIKREDDGFYTCRLKRIENFVAYTREDHVQLSVEDKPNITHPEEVSISVREGSSLNISCTAVGKVHPGVSWHHAGRVRSLGSGRAYLSFSPIKRAEAGTYICKANNSAGITEKQFNITVTYPAYIEKVSPPSPHESWIAQTVNFVCKANSVPAPTIIWKTPDGTEIKIVGGSLNIAPVQMQRDEDFGPYTCEANNSIGSAAIATVLLKQIKPPGAPTITTQDDDIKVTSFTVRWTAPDHDGGSPITGYVVIILQGGIKILYRTTNTAIKSHFVQGLIKSTNYTLRVSAMNKAYEGAASVKKVMTKAEDAPGSVEIIGFPSETKNVEVTIIWNEPQNNGAPITQYSVYQRIVNDDGTVREWNKIKEIKDLSRRQVVVKLEKNKVYEFVVTATNRRGESLREENNIRKLVVFGATPRPLASQTGSCSLLHAVYISIIIFLVIVIIILCVVMWKMRRRPCPRCRDLIPLNPVAVQVKDNLLPPSEQTNEAGTIASPSTGSGYYMPLHPSGRSWEVSREDIHVIKVIGKGAFSQVAQATVRNLKTNEEKTTVAVKMLKDNAPLSDRKDLLSELELMKKMKPHPHVIKLMGCITEDDPLMVLIEYVPCGDLLGYLRKSRGLNDTYYKNPDVKPQTNLSSEQLMKFAWHVADGMSYLSSKKIIHRDLAARNVLVGEGERCKVTDFGMARNVEEDNIYTKRSRGRLPVKWTAYEALFYGVYTTQSDVWSYGVLLYEILTVGGSPYPDINARLIADKIQGGYRMPKPGHVDSKLYEIMMKCWEEDPSDRPTFEKLRKTMKDMERNHKTYVNLSQYDTTLYANMTDLTVD